MSLATRCPSCGTAFRVAQDQLKVSQGWVRCGQCDAVFNAVEGLFDLRDDDAAGSQSDAGPSTVTEPHVEPADRDREGTPSSMAELLADPIDAHLFGPRKRADVPRKPADYVGARDRLDFSDARFDSDLFAENLASGEEGGEATPGDAAALESNVQPGFLRRAERRARWQSRPARLALGAGSALALLLLAGQVAHHQRDALAADWPAVQPALLAWCQVAGCSLQSPRRIDDIRVESAALTRSSGAETYVLNVALRSRGRVALQVPSVELSLTDSNGRLLVRRALAPRDFRAAETIAAGAEMSLQALLATGGARVAGYTVEIFYP